MNNEMINHLISRHKFDLVKLKEETSRSKIYLVQKKNKTKILKFCKDKSQAKLEFNSLNKIYNLYSKYKKSLDFCIPKPDYINEKFNFFVMEYISNSKSLFDLILSSDQNKIRSAFAHSGKVLAQYHKVSHKLVDQKKKELNLKVLKKSKYSNIYSKFKPDDYKFIIGDFKSTNILIKKNKFYLIDFSSINTFAPFYYDLARFYDTTIALLCYKAPWFYLTNLRNIKSYLDTFLKEYDVINKINYKNLQLMRKIHQKEYSLMKYADGKIIQYYLLPIFFNLQK